MDNGPPRKKTKREILAGKSGKGTLGEKLSDIDAKSKTSIDLPNGKIRIPDELNRDFMVLREVKNVKKQGYTAQIRDFHTYSNDNGFSFRLVVREKTKISSILQKYIDDGEIILIRNKAMH